MPTVLASLSDLGISKLLGGALLMLAGAFGVTTFLADRKDNVPGPRTWATALPIMIAALVARLLHREEIAVGIVFGTSVALFSTVVGSVSSVAPVGPAPGRWRRMWAFVLTATLLTFLIGFNGSVNWVGAVILLAEGMLALWLWRDCAGHHRTPEGQALLFPLADRTSTISAVMAIIATLISLAAVGGGAVLATRGAKDFSDVPGHVPTGTLAATLLSLALVIPAMQSGRRLASAGRSWVAMTSQSGVVLINLCLLLPLLAVGPYLWAHGSAIADALNHRPTVEIVMHLLQFPLAVWRIDSVLLVILSILYLPVAMGKWNLGKEDGMLLVLAYFVYLIAATLVMARA